MLLSPSKVFACLTVVSIALGSAPTSSALQSAPKKSIRAVDFRNFSYPETEGLHIPHSRKRSFKLKDGELPETRDKLNQGLTEIIALYLAHFDPLHHAFERLELTHQFEQLVDAG